MTFDFSALEPQIHQILSAPGTDLTTISAKRVRRQLLELETTLTAEFLKDNKEEVDAVIASVFEKVSGTQGVGSSQDMEEAKASGTVESRKRKKEDDMCGDEDEDPEDEDLEEDAPPPKKAKKAGKKELSDAELARQLSSEINSRSRRTTGKSRGSANGIVKKGGRAKKSAAIIESDADSDGDGEKKTKPKRKAAAGGTAKGGFAKEYALSEPLAALLKVDKLSRPQVVKQLWVYIKDNDLQNPANKREIVCDGSFRAIFGVDKIDMFRMNKVLGQHLHDNEG